MAAIPTLIVDPDRGRRQTYHEVLGRSFSLHFAGDIDEGLNVFAKLRPALLIAMAELGEQSGIDLLRRIHGSVSARKPKILLVGEALDDAILGRDTARSMGADDLMKAPFTPDQLRRKVRVLITELAQESKSARPPAPEETPQEAPPQATPAAAAQPRADSGASGGLFAKEPPSIEAVRVFPGLSEAEIENVGAERLARIHQIFKLLDSLDYYAVLGVSRDVSPALARKAFHRHSRLFHPDRFRMVGSRTLADEVGQVFKRMSEAYKTLTNPEDRELYDRQLEQSPEQVRLQRKDREVSGPRSRDVEIKHPQARKFYNLGVAALGEGNAGAAKMNLQLALSMAPNEAAIKEKLDDVARLLDG